uniref:Uncharacterized protein n=1 Tax=Arion vulgaris TaxID=1028688 RepID=A0A0B7BDI3_9EUPU
MLRMAKMIKQIPATEKNNDHFFLEITTISKLCSPTMRLLLVLDGEELIQLAILAIQSHN